MSRQTPDVKLAKTRVEFTFDVADVEPLQLRYGVVRFRPQAVTVTVVDGEVYDYVKVEGPNVKKDGSVGQGWHDRGYHPRYDREEMPAWLPGIATLARQRYADMDNAARIAEGK